MDRLTPNTFVTFCRGMALPTLAHAFAEAGHPARASGESSGWAWVTHDADEARASGQSYGWDLLTHDASEAEAAYAADRSLWDLARDITGFRYADRVPQGQVVETVFLASTPPCACPHGQNFMVPHCDRHPFQFAYYRGGFEQTYFNVGERRESIRAGGQADLLVRELLNAGIVGRDTPNYDTDPGFNADGAQTVRIIVEHFGLPSPPLLPPEADPASGL